MNSLSKSINSRFRPSYVGGMPVFMCGGKMRYDLGGMMSANPMQFAQEGAELQGYAADSLISIGDAMRPTGYKKTPMDSAMDSALKGSKYGLLGAALGGLTGYFTGKKQIETDKVNQQQSIMNSQLQNLLSNLPEQQQYTMANGGYLPSYATGGMLQGSTSIKTGGTHESSSLGGVPIGNQGKVEEGEYIWNSPNGKYVFSSRF